MPACRVAALVVGSGHVPNATLHASYMREYVLLPLAAEIFLVTDPPRPGKDASTSVAVVMPALLGQSIEGVAAYDTWEEGTVALLQNLTGVKPRTVARPPRPAGWVQPYAAVQWHRLQAAWALMEERERRARRQFELVVKLRADSVPLPRWRSSRVCGVARSDPGNPRLQIRTSADRPAQLTHKPRVASQEASTRRPTMYSGAHAPRCGLQQARGLCDRRPILPTRALRQTRASRQQAYLLRLAPTLSAAACGTTRSLRPSPWTTSCKASPRRALAPLTARAGASLARPHPLDAQHSLHPQSIVPRPTPLPQIGELPLIADAPRTPSVGADAWERGEARRQVVLGALQRMLREWRYIDPRWAGAPRLMWPPGDRTHGCACPHLSPHPETHRVRVAGAAPMRPLRLRHAFYSEHALLMWALASNVSIKELALGTGTRYYLFKGTMLHRPLPEARRCCRRDRTRCGMASVEDLDCRDTPFPRELRRLMLEQEAPL